MNDNVIIHTYGRGTWKDNYKGAQTNEYQQSTCTFGYGDHKMYMCSEMDKSSFYCPLAEIFTQKGHNSGTVKLR
jgi:hypothetical protein